MLSCTCSLVTDFPQGVRECREPELGLEELLRHRCQLLQQHEEYQVGLRGRARGPPILPLHLCLFSALCVCVCVLFTCFSHHPFSKRACHLPHASCCWQGGGGTLGFLKG